MKRLLAIAALVVAATAHAWTPPANPDPDAILRSAVEDRLAGRYADALEKHEWFHQEALKHNRALAGVRNSFAIAWWAELGAVYAPAKEALRKARDDAGAAVRAGRSPVDNFADFASINREIDDPLATVSVFLDLDKRDPALAKRVYHYAQDPLIDAKYFDVAARYIDPKVDLLGATDTYKRMAARPAPSKDVDFTALNERYFGTTAARLIAVLVIANRRPEAEQLAKEALQVSSSDTVKSLVDNALQGQIPPSFISTRDRTRPAPGT